MKTFARIFLTITVLFLTNVIAQTPDIGITATLALGEVAAINAAGNRVEIKTKDGLIAAVIHTDTEFRRVLPEKPTDLKASVASRLSEIGEGDRIIAQGLVSGDKKTIRTRRIFLMTKADFGRKQEIEREKWLTHGIAGRITALKSAANEITVVVRNGFGVEQSARVETNRNTTFRRYSNNSVRFSDAQPSSFAELKIGDQLRGRGEKSPDGSKVMAEEIVFGTFRTVAGKITTINAAKGEVTIKDLQTNQDIMIAINGDTILRRFPAETAARLARSQPNKSTQLQNPTNSQTSATTVTSEERDFDALLEQMPVLNLSGLKVGDAIAASCITGNDVAHLTAVKFLAGVEPFLTPKQSASSQQPQRAAPSFNIPGLDGISIP